MSKSKVNVQVLSGVPFIFLAFFFAKITGYIDWSWLWVLSPLWLPLAIFLVCMGVVFLLTLIAALIK